MMSSKFRQPSIEGALYEKSYQSYPYNFSSSKRTHIAIGEFGATGLTVNLAAQNPH